MSDTAAATAGRRRATGRHVAGTPPEGRSAWSDPSDSSDSASSAPAGPSDPSNLSDPSKSAEPDPNLSRKVRSGAIWSGARTLVMRFANIAVMAVVARILSPEAFGVFAVAITVHTVVSSIGDLGVGSMLARGDVDLDEYAPTVASISLISSIVLGGLMFLFAVPLATSLGSAQAAGPMRVMAIAVLLVGVFAVPGAQLVREFRQDKQFLATIISFVPGNASLLLLAWHGDGAMAFAWSRVIGQLAMGLTMTAMVSKRYWPGFARSTVRPLLLFGLPLAGANLLNYTLLNTDYAFVGHALGPEKLGIYLLAFNIASWSTSLLSGMINGVAMPAFSRIKADPQALQLALVKSFRAVAFFALPITGMTLALARPLVVTVYGAKWVAAAPVLSILTAYGAISVLSLLLSNVLVGMGRPKLLLYVQIVWLAVLVPVMFLGVHYFGIMGAGYAHILVILALVAPIYLSVTRRSTGVRARQLLLAILPAAISSAVAAVSATGVVHLIGPEPLQLLAGAAVGGVVYLLCMAVEFRQLVSVPTSPGIVGRVLRAYDQFGRRLAALIPGRSAPEIETVEVPGVPGASVGMATGSVGHGE